MNRQIPAQGRTTTIAPSRNPAAKTPIMSGGRARQRSRSTAGMH
jgi:hypothetical protein